ncbi:hypothetical protein CYMTET_35287 [Cymbomonas tetramitiformis]|uniref:SET domain-containing protein n=1 Tax=Cymbomonas tetramitiformis TaxID=36881 RepID=A0AAE0F9F1_9CHLO|nr:hypothetical protein CYMTET_35287 [Cymbomonas tetramitiformis]
MVSAPAYARTGKKHNRHGVGYAADCEEAVSLHDARLMGSSSEECRTDSGGAAARALEAHWSPLDPGARTHLLVLCSVVAACCAASCATPCEAASAPTPVAVTRALCQIYCNSHAVTGLDAGREWRTGGSQAVREERRVAMAVYGAAAMLNHSCVAATTVSYEGRSLVLRCTDHIEAGAELSHCYGPQQGEMGICARQVGLWEQYHFRCQCAACCGPRASLGVDQELVGYACPTAGCTGALPPPSGVTPDAALLAGRDVSAGPEGGGEASRATITSTPEWRRWWSWWGGRRCSVCDRSWATPGGWRALSLRSAPS